MNAKGRAVGFGIGIIDSEDRRVVDVIDERGFEDGVKVARKCSKANVLGKAVEYIRVLKKWEHRLKAEKAGMKSLIGGLVGGPDHPILLFTQQGGTIQQQQQSFFNHNNTHNSFWLSLLFALYSFFNSLLTSSSSTTRQDHSHTGTLLNTLHPPLVYAPDIMSQFTVPLPPNNTSPGWTWQNYIQVFHLLVPVLILASFVGSWFGIRFGFGFKKKAGSVRGSLRDGDKGLF